MNKSALLSLFVYLFNHLIKQCYAQIENCTELSPPYKTMLLSRGEIHYLDLASLFNREITQQDVMKFSTDTEPLVNTTIQGIELTHGGPVTSEIADILPNSICDGQIIGASSTSTVLVCKSELYLMDSSKMSRSASLKAPSPEYTFLAASVNLGSTNGYSIIISFANWTLDKETGKFWVGTNHQLGYLNAFDSATSSKNSSNLIPSDLLYGIPTWKYFSTSSSKFIIFYDAFTPGFKYIRLTNWKASFYIRKTEPGGSPIESKEDNKDFVDPFFDQDNPRTEYNSAILEQIYTSNWNNFFVLYAEKSKYTTKLYLFRLQSNTILSGIQPSEFPKYAEKYNLFESEWTKDLFTETVDPENKYSSFNILIRLIRLDYYLVHNVATGDSKVCFLNDSIDYVKADLLATCSSVFRVDLSSPEGNGIVLRVTDAFAVDGRTTQNFLLEVKQNIANKNRQAKTIRSLLFRFNGDLKSNSEVVEMNRWEIVSDTQWTMNYIGGEKLDKKLSSLRSRTLERFPLEMKYLKLDINQLFKSSKDETEYSINSQTLYIKADSQTAGSSCTKRKIIIRSPFNAENSLFQYDKLIDNVDSTLDYTLSSTRAGSVKALNFDTVEIYGNNLDIYHLEEQDKANIFIGQSIKNIRINVDAHTPNYQNLKFVEMTFQGAYLIGVTKPENKDKEMHLFKCSNLIYMKEMGETQHSGYKPSIDCKFLKSYPVNNLVDLVEAKVLNDYLIVRFKSENSVVYLRIDIYNFVNVEINLKGYDPTRAWMAQLNSNTILICHFKQTSTNPFSIFSLKGESMTKKKEPNIDKFKTSKKMGFKAGALIEEEGKVYLYLALNPTNNENNISFGKFNIPAENESEPTEVKSGHDIFGAVSKLDDWLIEKQELCFLSNRIFVIARMKSRQVSQTKQTRAFIMDINNPNLDYEFPSFESYGITDLNDIVPICNPDTNIVIIKGVTYEEELNKRTYNIYLNGNFTDANNRILRIDLDTVEDCTVSFPTNYIAEICAQTAKSDRSDLGFEINLLNLTNPNLYFRTNQAGEASYSVGVRRRISAVGDKFSKEVRQKVNLAILESEPIREAHLDKALAHEAKKGDVFDVRTEEQKSKHLPFVMPIEETLQGISTDLNNHFFRTRLIKTLVTSESKTASQNDPFVPVKFEEAHLLNGISIKERFVFVKIYSKIKESDSSSSSTSDKYSSFDRIAKKGNYFSTVSIISKYQTLSTAINFYLYNESNATFQQMQGRIDLPDICNEFDFDVITHKNGSIYAMIGVICNLGTNNVLTLIWADLTQSDKPTNKTDFSDRITKKVVQNHGFNRVDTVQVIINNATWDPETNPDGSFDASLLVVGRNNKTKLFTVVANQTQSKARTISEISFKQIEKSKLCVK